MTKKKVAVLISGDGSNLQALIDAARMPEYPAQIVLVISNKAEAFGLKRAKDAGISSVVINHKDYASREAFDDAMHIELVRHEVEIICLAGFMRLLSERFVKRWEGRMLNIHPSLLPDFKGAHAVRDALAAGATESGCTVHLVTHEVDSGETILQAHVPVMSDDTEETLHQRIHKEEHRIYPEALKLLTEKL